MENRCECSKDTYHCRCWEEGKACCYCDRVKQDQEREEREAQSRAIHNDYVNAIQVDKPIGDWDIGGVHIAIYKRPTGEQIKNIEDTFGWKWNEY